MMTALFCEMPIGEWFTYDGGEYQKTAESMAVDREKRWGNVFQGDIEVEVPDGTPLHHGPRIPERSWLDYLTPSPMELPGAEWPERVASL
jgi:hypothetical protein